MHSQCKDTPLVTVVTATFNLLKANREKFFRECVASVRSQTYPNIEHLVIDGASTDGTKEMLEELAAKGEITLVSEPDKGIYDAMNKGIRLAKGKYIAFLNSDDYWHDNRGVEFSVRELEREQADFSFASRRLVDEEGNILLENEETQLGFFFCLLPFCHQTMFTRTELLREIGGFDAEHYRVAADYDVMVRLILDGRREVEVPLNFTSFRMGGISSIDDADVLIQKECQALHRRYFSPIIGEEAANGIWDGKYRDEFVSYLLGRVRPSVAVSYFRKQMLHPPAPRIVWTGPLQIPLLSRHSRCPERVQYRLFSFLPLLTITRNIRRGRTTHHYKLFGFLPLWKHVHNDWLSDKHYLFGCFPIFAQRNRT